MSSNDSLRSRIEERVNTLGISPITLAKSAGLERGYINDLLIGRKKSIRGDKLNIVAKALQCDPEYLLLEQDEVRKHKVIEKIEFGGVCEAGVWRSASLSNQNSGKSVPIEPDPRFPHLRNIAFDVRGNSFAAEGISDGMTVAGIALDEWTQTIGPLSTGMIVVAHANRADGSEFELSLRRVSVKPNGISLSVRPTDPTLEFPSIDVGNDVKIVAVITRAVRLFLDVEAPL
ncbi:helix-turn-helix domain-containing protein [Brucella anthropi]|uniref:Helix-turn-helix domain protein n=1 Tax=Brucella anthropi (strain ATCC 49188 / DSM 6882 / CCUG 24695 / JCM 21032 / LMG 3331 / NBRC 15819 / NCTC 12168 / Alc 37) TaxID=439375 RepID=A6WZ55_BRUA4|nr:helix-turn-helix transcriptional regulator [Brucella anthropi]ABS14259.1 helix-turn-helix domain protein [Brucella anthropi ATCC 49188]NKC48147.1 helix-turn-helix domain-containing protein [Brucella anthropi ATCC 49188]QQC25790.1 helix-turn-helix domain-containing protein [Brucella anthropi]RRY08856.1 transcriptional regulator [Brucella anthropi]SUA65421.1 Uncharacterised protein [Brucella anthropi]